MHPTCSSPAARWDAPLACSLAPLFLLTRHGLPSRLGLISWPGPRRRAVRLASSDSSTCRTWQASKAAAWSAARQRRPGLSCKQQQQSRLLPEASCSSNRGPANATHVGAGWGCSSQLHAALQQPADQSSLPHQPMPRPQTSTAHRCEPSCPPCPPRAHPHVDGQYVGDAGPPPPAPPPGAHPHVDGQHVGDAVPQGLVHGREVDQRVACRGVGWGGTGTGAELRLVLAWHAALSALHSCTHRRRHVAGSARGAAHGVEHRPRPAHPGGRACCHRGGQRCVP